MTAKDIIKLTIIGISLMDFLVFTGLFVLYLLVIQFKTNKIEVKIGGILIILFFLTFKFIHIPVFLSYVSFFNITVPGTDYIIITIVWVNILLALGPVLSALYTFIKNLKKQNVYLFEHHVNIIMPIYNEEPKALLKAIESVQNLEYNHKKIHLYLAFDDEEKSPAYNKLVEKWLLEDSTYNEIKEKIKISICRFKHGGKKSAQEGAYKKIKEKYTKEFLENSYLFFIDSDIILNKDCLYEFMKYMKEQDRNSLTGMITCVTSQRTCFLSLYQDVEYISGQLFWRNMEDVFKCTSCLPGAFTMMKYSTFSKVAQRYFDEKEYSDSFDYQRFYLGEDRYLTHLIMMEDPHKIGFCERARCKTNAPDNIMGLLKQRRRWFLGHISNDTWLISSLSLWRKYPLFCMFNFLNNSRNTSIYVYFLYFILYFNEDIPVILWFLHVILPICIYWSLLIYYAFVLKRRVNVIFYTMIVMFQPIFSMMFMYYTLYTFKKRTWGGKRVETKNDEEKNL